MIACPSQTHRHPFHCEGCDAAVGPDDCYRTTTRRVAICSECWRKWRRSGYGRRAA